MASMGTSTASFKYYVRSFTTSSWSISANSDFRLVSFFRLDSLYLFKSFMNFVIGIVLCVSD